MGKGVLTPYERSISPSADMEREGGGGEGGGCGRQQAAVGGGRHRNAVTGRQVKQSHRTATTASVRDPRWHRMICWLIVQTPSTGEVLVKLCVCVRGTAAHPHPCARV